LILILILILNVLKFPVFWQKEPHSRNNVDRCQTAMALVGVWPGPSHDDRPTHAYSAMMRSSLPTSNIGILGRPEDAYFSGGKLQKP
jgi:hypothetical protein